MPGEVVHEDEVRTRKSFNGYSALSGFAFFQSIDQKPSHGTHLLVPQINALLLQRPLMLNRSCTIAIATRMPNVIEQDCPSRMPQITGKRGKMLGAGIAGIAKSGP